MRLKNFSLIAIVGATFLHSLPLSAQEWALDPGYDLPRNAAIKPAPVDDFAPLVRMPIAAPLFFGAEASESRILAEVAPEGDLTLELWLLDHVNNPVGALLSVGEAHLGYMTGRAAFGVRSTLNKQVLPRRGYKSNWRHLVLTRSGPSLTLYVDGAAAATSVIPPGTLQAGPIRLDAYLKNEPNMQVANLVQVVSVDPKALSALEVLERFTARTKLVDEGRIFANQMHFTQPPYLNTPSLTSMELSFEFDRAATSTIEVGLTEADLKVVSTQMSPARLHGARLMDLSPDTPYFYRVSGRDEAGNMISSGLLSFRTAPSPGRPFTFVAIGDTEARAHVNNAISQQIWPERPNLMLIAGDLTDGGSAERRFEWTHEYFRGMGPLFGRVPVVAAIGNGEQELKWFRHYHRQPEPENYYSLVYGDVEFFVLDSYLKYREKSDPGFRARQRAWLEQALSKSNAKWKIALHHHDTRTSDEDDYGNSWRGTSQHGDSEVQTDFVPLFERFGVDLVLFGHLHSYERSWPLRGNQVDIEKGVTYLQVGGAGGNLEDFAPNKPWFSRQTFRDHHYAAISVSDSALDIRVVDMSGRLRDQFQIKPANRAKN
jgi:hypothetical protein